MLEVHLLKAHMSGKLRPRDLDVHPQILIGSGHSSGPRNHGNTSEFWALPDSKLGEALGGSGQKQDAIQVSGQLFLSAQSSGYSAYSCRDLVDIRTLELYSRAASGR